MEVEEVAMGTANRPSNKNGQLFSSLEKMLGPYDSHLDIGFPFPSRSTLY